MDEAEGLLRVTLAADKFRNAGMLADLLTYLVRHRNEYTQGEVLWVEVFKKNLDTYYGGVSMRERIMSLKKALVEVFPPFSRGARLVLEGISGKGWRVAFEPGLVRVTDVFWRAHLDEQREVMVVINQPLFFRDEEKRLVFRCYDVNPEKKTIPEMVLKQRRPDMFKEMFEAVQPYLLSGEVSARDAILKFFSDNSGIAPTSAVSGRMTDDTINRTSPILLGDSGTNRFIDSFETGMLGTKAALNIGWLAREDYLRYRLTKPSTELPRGGVWIYRASDEEKSMFPNGTPQRARPGGTEEVQVYSLKNDPCGFVYGVVTRMVNPYNSAPLTIISCSFSEAVEQIAKLLTTESAFINFAEGLPWQSGALPRVFQGLFAVHLGDPNLDAGALIPQAVAWRDLMSKDTGDSSQAT